MISKLRETDFESISRLVYKICGINLHDGKKELVTNRLSKHLRKRNFQSFDQYLSFVQTKEGSDELVAMIDSLSTNLTSFFREERHFQKLNDIVSELIRSQHITRLRIWSAGCSTGEEPYSIAMKLMESIEKNNIDLKILATDISTRTLRIALAGIYPVERVKTIPSAILKKYFQIGQGKWKGYYRVKKELKDIITFMRFNLMKTPSFTTPMDIIFCRNVMIYFDKETKVGLVNRFYDCLKKGGYLFIGHSESLTGLTNRFHYMEPTVYRK